ncbi:hypothetical protein FACS1894110_16610 [Spirochaetia bacterium]|nr:hypothetical protein FACS1894110_16610 [Spirochaetia bacterium]
MIKFDKYYKEYEKKNNRENAKKLKAKKGDPRAISLLVFSKYLEALDSASQFIKVCKGPEDQKNSILEKTAALKADIQKFTANL